MSTSTSTAASPNCPWRPGSARPPNGYSTGRRPRVPPQANTLPYRFQQQTTSSVPAQPTWEARWWQALRIFSPPAKDAKVLKTFVTKEHHATFRGFTGLLGEPGAHEYPDAWTRPGGGLDGDGLAAHDGGRCAKRDGAARPCLAAGQRPACRRSGRTGRSRKNSRRSCDADDVSYRSAGTGTGPDPPPMRDAVGRLAPSISQVVNYHLGWTEADGAPSAARGGKGIRPALAMLSAEATWAGAEVGAPGGVAIELVHNFSLVHDDLMDGDLERRHRPTVWALWGPASPSWSETPWPPWPRRSCSAAPTRRRPRQRAALGEATAEMIAGQADDLPSKSGGRSVSRSAWPCRRPRPGHCSAAPPRSGQSWPRRRRPPCTP